MAPRNGRTDPQSPTSPHRIESRERHQRALNMRRGGANYQQIADVLGYSGRRSAQKAVVAELEAQPGEDVAIVRKMETDRLDALLAAMWRKALNGDGWSVDRCLRIMERRSRLLGLDEPLKQQIEVITESVLDAEIARMTGLLAEREAARAAGADAEG